MKGPDGSIWMYVNKSKNKRESNETGFTLNLEIF